jgi:hypothetical protein
MLKGWAVTLVAGIFALSANGADKRFFIIAYIPVLVFWFLDAYYLFQEKLYIYLYNEVRLKDNNEIDFDLRTERFKTKIAKPYLKCFFSKTEIFYYLPLALICTITIFIVLK